MKDIDHAAEVPGGTPVERPVGRDSLMSNSN